jgi:GAF domain-containing protein
MLAGQSAPQPGNGPHDHTGLVAELALAARRVSTVTQLLEAMAEKTAATLGADSAAIFVRRESGEFRCAAGSHGGQDTRVALPADAFVARRLRRPTIAMTVGEGDFASWRAGLVNAPESLREARENEISALCAVRAAVLVAIALKEHLVGMLALGPRPAGAYSPDDLRVLAAVAGPLSFVIENAQLVERVAEQERLKKEIALAAEVQRRLFSEHEPSREELELLGYCLPAREVGGG